MSGYVHVYTGNGKGKTTAAIGLAIRAAGAGLPVLFAQFVKGMKYSEITALERFNAQITVRQYGRGCFIYREPADEDIRAARNGLDDCTSAVVRGDHRLVILDEATIAVHFNLIHVDDLLRLLACRKQECEIVITGRYAPPELIAVADLVTEMKEIRHYYSQGVTARTGIER